MSKNISKSAQKLTKNLIKKEKVRPQNKNREEELTEKEYNEVKKKCFFFLRRTYSQNEINKNNNIHFKSSSNRKKKRYKKLVNMTKILYNSFIKLEPPKKIKKKEEKIIYDNLQPKSVWLNCKKIYNKYKNEFKPLIKESIINLKKNINNRSISKQNKNFLDIYDTSFRNPPSPPKFERGNYRTKSLLFSNNRIGIKFHQKSFSSKQNENNKDNHNFIKCLEEINQNFENKGINYIIKNRNLSKITNLPKFKTDNEKLIKKLGGIEIKKRNLPNLFPRKMSIIFRSPITLESSKKKKGGDQFYQYKLNSFFEIGTEKNNNNKNEEEEEENDLEIISKQGNVIIRELLFSKKENLENYKENQSIFNFFCLKKIFDVNDYNIFGVINGKGKESKKLSRLLKEILIEKFSDENNYFKTHDISKPKNFKFKNDFIFNILTLEGYIFIKNIFNSLTNDLKNKGVDIEETGATLFIIILIKDKIISIKIGDMYSYYIYSISNEKDSDQIIIKNLHLEHSISNIIEQDRLEENNCEFNLTKDELGKNEYNIIYNDSEIQNYIYENNIKFTRMIAFSKLKKIGIIGEPDIQLFSVNIGQNLLMHSRRNSNVESSLNFDFRNLNNKKEIDTNEGNLKFIIIGNNELFEFLKNKYYIKEINEALLKDEENNKNKDNIKYFFNLKNTVKKLVNDSVEIHKKYMKIETFKERCMALITLT